MRITAKPLTVTAENPFAEDTLNRKPAAEAIVNLLKNTAGEHYVIGLNAVWGQGKTTFLRMLQQHLNNNDINCLLVNAWKNDFSQQPMLTLLSDFNEAINSWRQASGLSKTPESIIRFGKNASNVLKAVAPAVVRISTGGIVGDETIGKLVSSLAEESTKEALEQHQKARESIDVFKENLANIAKEMGKVGEGKKPRPLVVLVDEIDRCRPDFAVNYLECIKHFFNVPNVVFIVATDREQLGHSLRTLYGAGMDVDGYLRRFVNLEFNLPTPDRKRFGYALIRKFELEEKLSSFISQEEGDAGEQLKELFVFLAEATDMSLRDMEKAATLIALVLLSTQDEKLLFAPLVAMLITLKIKKPELYASYVNGEVTGEHVIEQIWDTNKIDSVEESPLSRIALLEASLIVFSPLSLNKKREIEQKYVEKYQSLQPKQGDSASNEFIKVGWTVKYFSEQFFAIPFGELGVILQRIDLFTE